jgi:hypothetical protein
MYEENLNSVDKWPVLHASTPTQMDNKSTRGTIVPIEVSSSSIVSVDPYIDVREFQLAKIFYNMFNMLGISSFSDFFKSEEDVYHFILGHRVASDQGDSTTGGTTDLGSGDNSGGTEEGGDNEDTGGTTEIPEFPEPTGFTNPLPNLVNARGSLLPTSQNAALQIIYSYDTKADKISINYDYLDYDVWVNQYADFVFNLSDVVKVSNNQFKFYQQPYGDSLTSKNIYALVLTYNTSNNTISITAEFTPTGDSDLDELLASEIVLESYTPIN